MSNNVLDSESIYVIYILHYKSILKKTFNFYIYTTDIFVLQIRFLIVIAFKFMQMALSNMAKDFHTKSYYTCFRPLFFVLP